MTQKLLFATAICAIAASLVVPGVYTRMLLTAAATYLFVIVLMRYVYARVRAGLQ